MLSIQDEADFTWNFGSEFYLETSKGNYVWSSPDYGGDNTIKPTQLSLKGFLGKGYHGRSKGKHSIESFCGSEVNIQQYTNSQLAYMRGELEFAKAGW